MGREAEAAGFASDEIEEFYFLAEGSHQWRIYPNALKGREVGIWLGNRFCCRKVVVEVVVTLASCELLCIYVRVK